MSHNARGTCAAFLPETLNRIELRLNRRKQTTAFVSNRNSSTEHTLLSVFAYRPWLFAGKFVSWSTMIGRAHSDRLRWGAA